MGSTTDPASGTGASGRVIDADGDPIPGLFACGEMVGGRFYSTIPVAPG